MIVTFLQGGLSTSTIQVTVFTDKPNYRVGETVYVYGEVKEGELPIENAYVAIEIRDPSASPIVIRTLITDTLGKYGLSFSLSSQALLGTYTIYVSVIYGGEKATNTASFSLEGALPFTLTLMIGRSAYKVEEPIEIYGNATLAEAPLSGVLVAIEVHDPKDTTVLLRVVQTDSDGIYRLTFQLPSGSSVGNYSVYASASRGDQKATAVATFRLTQTISADINEDGVVNIIDITIAAMAWASYPGHPRWNPKCDLDGNGVINIIDIMLIAREYRP
jgi:uncharacterized protein YfaS (alpha-2-macroglobulin family)